MAGADPTGLVRLGLVAKRHVARTVLVACVALGAAVLGAAAFAGPSPAGEGVLHRQETSSASYLHARTRGCAVRFGISCGDRLVWLSSKQLAAQLDDAARLGVTWIRLDLNWFDIQPENASSYRWTNFDRVVRAARSRGLSLLAIISYTPPWARPLGATNSDSWAPADPAQFAAFAAKAVRRYAPRGIHTWEIWNEPNSETFWKPHPDPNSYVRLLRLTTKAMREADPGVFIVSGGLAQAKTDASHIAALEYFNDMCRLGANRLVDAVGDHPYSFPLTPLEGSPWNLWGQMTTTHPSFRSILKQYGTPDLPIWATEYGVPTNGPGKAATTAGWDSQHLPDHATEAYQAVLAVDSVKAAMRTPHLGALFWYTNVDRGTDTNDKKNFFGLRRFDRRPKPAYYALRRAINRASRPWR